VVVRVRHLLAAGLGLCASHLTSAQEPGRLGLDGSSPSANQNNPSANQQMANELVRHRNQSGRLRNYRIDLVCRNGVVEVNGSVADQTQRDEALRLIQGFPGVDRVHDRLTLADGSVRQAQAGQLPPPLKEGAVENPQPGAKGGMPEPMPTFSALSPGLNEVAPPRMPPHAWPTYAPYNNFSRVAYPTAYPYNAWPFIGPVYPFPKVPLGWRSVKLEFEDGHWWYGKVGNPHDWWRLRYW